MHWDLTDFGFFGAMLLSAVIPLTLAVRKSRSFAYRAGAVLAVGSCFLLVWANAAVGIIGDEGGRSNLLFAAVLLAAVGGAFLARGQARGLARAMFAAALVNALICALALVFGWGQLREVLLATGLFSGLFVASALLFLHAERSNAAPAH